MRAHSRSQRSRGRTIWGLSVDRANRIPAATVWLRFKKKHPRKSATAIRSVGCCRRRPHMTGQLQSERNAARAALPRETGMLSERMQAQKLRKSKGGTMRTKLRQATVQGKRANGDMRTTRVAG